MVIDPNGLTLGGDFIGVHVPQGTVVAFGDYRLESKCGHKVKIISYRSAAPFIPLFDGSYKVHFDIHSHRYGDGVGLASITPMLLTDGRVVANIRNVLTFPGDGKDVEHLLQKASTGGRRYQIDDIALCLQIIFNSPASYKNIKTRAIE